MRRFLLVLAAALLCAGQSQPIRSLGSARSILDAHNCYPYEGQYADRIERALALGYPVAIEQDLAWGAPAGPGKVVVGHSATTIGTEPTLKAHFFERVRPLVEKALAANRRSQWPIIVLHFDNKDNREPLLRAVWKLLGEYQSQGWITTAVKGPDPHVLAPLDVRPLLVLTEDNDAQQEIYFDDVPVGGKLRIFGSAHTTKAPTDNSRERTHWLATAAPEVLLAERPTNYRRWWNNAWNEVEEGGQTHAGDWTPRSAARLKALVDYAHGLGFWIRFYTLDGFTADTNRGWDKSYNFGSLAAVEARWRAALDAGVDLIASDQYEDLAACMRAHGGVAPRPAM